MSKTKKSWDILSDRKRSEYCKYIIDYFESERDESIGHIAAGELLDLFLRIAAIDIYNQGIENAITIMEERFQDLKLGIIMLKKNDN